MDNRTELIVYLILLVLLLFFSGKIAWKYSPDFISGRDRWRNSKWVLFRIRMGMVGSTLFVVFFIYDMIFLEPLQKKMKPINDNKVTISDTSESSQSKSVSNENNKNKHKHKREHDTTHVTFSSVSNNNISDIDSTQGDSLKN